MLSRGLKGLYRRIARLPGRNEDAMRGVAADLLVRHQLPIGVAELGARITA